MKKLFAILLAVWSLTARAAEVIPPVPEHYFNDYAQVVPYTTTDRLNRTLEQFERQTSSQILVAVYPKMQSDSSIEDYTVRVAQSWKVGQKAKDNGAVLFVFIQDRKMYLQVGYGLEGVLPDALCKRIIEDEIKPYFKSGDYGNGLSTGVAAIILATQGEYTGTGRTVADATGGSATRSNSLPVPVIIFIIVAVVLWTWIRWKLGIWGGFTSYSSSGGWSSGSGGGGFSGGGGSFGGGGAGGSW